VFKAFQRWPGSRNCAAAPWTIFGKTEERRRSAADRRLHQAARSHRRQAEPGQPCAAVALASVPDEIRGYGHVKEKNLAKARLLQAERLAAFNAPVVLMKRA
jgi:indolepyruvate ferredoxin oxidoreductase